MNTDASGGGPLAGMHGSLGAILPQGRPGGSGGGGATKHLNPLQFGHVLGGASRLLGGGGGGGLLGGAGGDAAAGGGAAAEGLAEAAPLLLL